MKYDAIEEVEKSSVNIKLRTTEEENVTLYNKSVPYSSPTKYTQNIETVYINPTQKDRIIIITCTDDDGREQLLGMIMKESNGGYFGLNCEVITNNRMVSGGSGGTSLYGVEVYMFAYLADPPHIGLRQNVKRTTEYENVYTVRKYYYL